MLHEIKHRHTGAILFATEAESLKKAVEAAAEAGANLGGANLDGANLDGASLDGASLDGASLYRASLYRANLYRANLGGANLGGANLGGASLDGASLDGASLYRASLDGASLDGASLYRASLGGASLGGASLYRANLENAKLPGFQIPQEGSLVVWKKLRNQVLAKLLIPAEAARTASLVGRKCRAAFADVLVLVDAAGNEVAKERSKHDPDFWYVAGQRVTPDAYSNDVREECQAGIHFFQTKEEAQAYN